MREQLPNGSSMEDQRTSTDFHLDKIIARNLAYLTDITDSIQRCSSNNKSISFTRVAPTYKKEAHLLRDYHSILWDNGNGYEMLYKTTMLQLHLKYESLSTFSISRKENQGIQGKLIIP